MGRPPIFGFLLSVAGWRRAADCLAPGRPAAPRWECQLLIWVVLTLGFVQGVFGARVVQRIPPGYPWYEGSGETAVITGNIIAGNDIPNGNYVIHNDHGALIWGSFTVNNPTGSASPGTVLATWSNENWYSRIPYYPERQWADSADIPWGQEFVADYQGYLLISGGYGPVVGTVEGGFFLYGSAVVDPNAVNLPVNIDVPVNCDYTIFYNPSTQRQPQPSPPPRPSGPILLAGDDAAPAQHRKVALSGRALPDGKPQTAPETDAAREETYVDAYSLGLRHDTTDIYVPVGGGSELALQVRRATTPEVWSQRHGLQPAELPDRPFGSGWTSNLGANLHFVRQTGLGSLSINVDANYVFVTDEDGSTYRFLIIQDPTSGQERYVSLPGARNGQEAYLNTLIGDGAGHWSFVRKYGTTLTYEDSGISQIIAGDRLSAGFGQGTETHAYARLTRVTDRTGAALVYSYPGSGTITPNLIAVTNSPSQRITIACDAQGRVNSVRDPRGNAWTYAYDQQPEPTTCQTLRSVMAPPSGADGTGPRSVANYAYSLTSIDDTLPGHLPEPHQHCDVATIQDPGGNTYHFTYQADQTRWTYLGAATGFHVSPGLPRLVTRVDLPDGMGSTLFQPHSFSSVVPDGGVDLVFYGHRASYVVDALGHGRLYQFSAPRLSILTTFKPYLPNREILDPLHVPRIVLFGGEVITSFQGDSATFNESDPANFSFAGNSVGAESYSFDLAAGMAPVTATDLSGNTTTFTYGDAWDFTANYAFLNGTSYAFGKYADPTAQTDAKGQQKLFTYFPAPAPGTYDPRARRLTRVVDEAGRRTESTLDSFGNRTSEKVYDAGGALAQWTDFEYQEPRFPGFVTASIRRALGGSNSPSWAADLKTVYHADNQGNVASETIAPGVLDLTTSYTYDLNNNKKTVTDPRGYTTAFNYDGQNHLTEVIYPATATGPGINHKQLVYDLAGHKVREVDERGAVTLFGYDALGRLNRTVRDLNRNGTEDAGDLATGVTYDAVGSRTFEMDANGHVTALAYDALQRIISKTDPCGYQTQYFYDGPNAGGSVFASSGFHPTRVTDRRGFTTALTYDPLYRLTSRQVQYGRAPDPVASATLATDYDQVGNPVRETDPQGNVTRKTYDAFNRLTATTFALGTPDQATRQSVFTSTGLAWQAVDENGRVTETQFDAAGRAALTLQPAVDDGTGTTRQPITQKLYDPSGNLAALIDPLGKRWDYAYDARNRRTAELAPAVLDAERAPNGPPVRPETDFTYNKAGNLTARTDPRGSLTEFVFDDANRQTEIHAPPVSAMQPDGSGATVRPVTRTDYDPAGNALQVTDPNGHPTVNTFDALNRLATTTDAENNLVAYGYDAEGNRTSVQDGKGQTTAFAFDGLRRLTRTTDAAGKFTRLLYDGVNQTARIDALGQETDYGYDARNRLKTVAYPSRSQDNLAYALDPAGNLLAVTLPNAADNARDVASTPDALNRVVSETSAGQTHVYAYDLAGRRVRTTFGGTGRTLASTFDDLGRLTGCVEGGRTTAFAYDLSGHALKKTLPDGESVTSSFDALGRISRIEGDTAGGVPLYASAYGYDAAGNVRKLDEYSGSALPARTVTMGYDRVDRLTGETVASGGVTHATAYAYDAAHNRTGKTVDGVTTAFTFNGLNQLAGFSGGPAGAVTFAYDDNGNRAARTRGAATDLYAYDAENRLVGLSQAGGANSAYAYDYRTRRVGRSEGGAQTRVVFSGGTSVQEYAVSSGGGNATLAAEYLRGPDQGGGGVGGLLYSLRNGGAPSFAHFDARGDVIARTDALGVLTYQASYEAWGTRTAEYGSSPDRQRASTKEEDPSGLLNEGQRYRDLETGEFLTRDPAGFVDGPNLYAYVRQNPWSKFDPEGLAEATLFDAFAPATSAFYRGSASPYGGEAAAVRHSLSTRVPILQAAATGANVVRSVGGAVEFGMGAAYTYGTGGLGGFLGGAPVMANGLDNAYAGFRSLQTSAYHPALLEAGIRNVAGDGWLGNGLYAATQIGIGFTPTLASGARALTLNTAAVPEMTAMRTAEQNAAKTIAVEGETVTVYRGTSHPDVEQTSNAVRRGSPVSGQGDEVFLTPQEAYEHAFHGRAYHPDGVSITTQRGSAAGYGTHTIEYQVPKSVFDRLPAGDHSIGERVFKNNIPDKYRIRTLQQ